MAAASAPPWHHFLFGNATEPLLLATSLLLTFCVLSGKWWLLAYVGVGLLLFGLVLLYALYLEHAAQEAVERRFKARSARPKPRRAVKS